MKRRAVLLTAFAALSVGLTLPQTARAPIIQGQTYASPTSGRPGAGITVSAVGARTNTSYYIHFLNFKNSQNGMLTCMSRTGVSHPDLRVSAAILSSSTGSIAARTVPIPTDVHTSSTVNHPAHPSDSRNGGPALFCYITSSYGYATRSASVTVL